LRNRAPNLDRERFRPRESLECRRLKFYGICFSFRDDGKRGGIEVRTMRAETENVIEEIKQSVGLLRRAL
jgi:hypothetical protein